MAALATQKVALPSTTPAFVAATAGGDTCKAGDDNMLVVKNASGASINVTLAAYPDTTPWGASVPDLIVAVPAGAERWIGPLSGALFTQNGGDVAISYSAVASVTVGCFAC